MPGVHRYTRRYISSDGGWGEQATESDYDAVTDVWWPDQQALDRTLAHIAEPGVADLIAADEGRFMDRSRYRQFVVVEEHEDLRP
jgi:hypothetical protein